jgi:outer membrane receptor protein involved in Fe transport
LRSFASILLLLALALTGGGAVARAQSNPTGVIRGTVTDDTGAAVSGALVTISGRAGASTRTDAKGAFSFPNVVPGSYQIAVSKAGYQSTVAPFRTIAAGAELVLPITLHTASLSSLRQIAAVQVARAGNFNTSTAAVNVVTAQTFGEQAQPQVTQVLNQVPGVQISYPGSSSNGAVPGAITFPNVRNGLSYETASLIDGHPLSVGLYGDYVTTFLNSYLLGDVEVVKGPGATAPQVNYAINGTVNFRTKDPTPDSQPFYTAGATNHGGAIYAFGISDTVDRLGFVVGLAGYSEPSALNGQQVYFDPTFGNPTFYGSPKNSNNQLYGGCTLNQLPNTNPKQYVSATYNQCSLLASTTLSGDYWNLSELLKFRYRIGTSTFLTASYFGSQASANQSANTSSLTQATFLPTSGYKGPIPAGSSVYYLNGFYAGQQPEYETNNEPIFQAEISSALGSDTIVGRYYHASIARIQTGGNPNPLVPTVMSTTLNGTLSGFPTFNNTAVQLPVWDYWNSTELDTLFGYSLEYTHPFGENDILTFAADANQASSVDHDAYPTYNYNGSQCPNDETALFCLNQSTSLPTGSQQNFTTFLLRNRAQISPQFAATVSLYQNIYHSSYPTNCTNTYISTTSQTVCQPNGTLVTVSSTPPPSTIVAPVNFNTSTPTHFDPRLGLEWRPHSNVAIRAAVGSAIAPPYLYVISQPNGSISYTPNARFATQTVNAGNLRPETAFGYDLGADYALHDGATYVSTDFFLNNLFGQFLQEQYFAGTCSVTPCPAQGVPLYKTSYVNLSNARYEGIELQITRAPTFGWGFVLAGSTQRGYPYDLPPNFYCSFVPTKKKPCTAANYDTNLAILPGNNYIGEYVDATGGTTAGVDNQSVPYLQGNAEINYRFRNGAFVMFGDTLYGKNNSYNEPPFGVAYTSLSYPINRGLSFQISGSNIFNAWSGLFPIVGGGPNVPLANGFVGATNANVLGPATWRFLFTQRFGGSHQGSGGY